MGVGRLDWDTLIRCYSVGAFPMADRWGRLGFYRADPRAVLELDALRVSSSLRRVLRKGVYEVRFDRDFEGVMRGCAERTEDRSDTWISEEIIEAFVALHERGLAHSVEAYDESGSLAGGLYGVTLGGAFMGESMFSRGRDASKVCLVHLVERLRQRGYELLDCQIQNPHLASLGVTEIPEQEYLRRLDAALDADCNFS